MIFQVRPARGSDAQYVMDIDLKCFDDPWPSDYWSGSNGLYINVATFYGTPIAMTAFTLAETEGGEKFVSLAKVAVKPAYRRRGVATLLMDTVHEFGRQVQAGSIMVTIPESRCSGPSSIAGWLAKAGFEAIAVHKAAFDSYGQDEDGFLFHHRLRAT